MTPAAEAGRPRSWIAALKRCSTQILLLVGVLLVGAPLFAQSWRIADFHDTVLIGEDGTALVKERISLVFIGQWHGIHRTIPIEYPGPRGTNYTLFLDVTAVTDGAGQKLGFETRSLLAVPMAPVASLRPVRVRRRAMLAAPRALSLPCAG